MSEVEEHEVATTTEGIGAGFEDSLNAGAVVEGSTGLEHEAIAEILHSVGQVWLVVLSNTDVGFVVSSRLLNEVASNRGVACFEVICFLDPVEF